MSLWNQVGSLGDSLTFDLFDFDKSQETPDIGTTPYTPTSDEFGILGLLKSDVDALGSEDYTNLQSKADEYRDLMMSDNVLSPEEMSDFDEQYELELQALTEKYDMEVERHGASRMAELVGRGVMETTTGQNTIAEDQQKYSDVYAGATADLLNKKQYNIKDAEAAKREMATKGYNLTSGILQQKRGQGIESMNLLQSYKTGEDISKIGRELSDSLRRQSWDQYQYNQQQSNAATTAGMILQYLGD